jgi:hypothetical protein
MKTHEFTLVLTESPSEANAESLYGICQDGTLAARGKAGHIHFHRVADSLEGALSSALADTRAAGMSVARVEMAPEAVLLTT